MLYLGAISKTTEWSVCFQGKPFIITVIQVYVPTTNAKETEVEGLWRPTRPSRTNTKKRCPFHHRGLEWKVQSQEIPGVTHKFVPGVQNEAGQRLTGVVSREHTGQNKHPFPTIQEMPLHKESPNDQHQNQTDYILCINRQFREL